MPDLFETAQRAVREADRHQLTYDKFFGYPTYMEIDWVKNAIDDETTYQSACLRQTSSKAATSDPCVPLPQS